MKPFAWSYSALTTYENCPKKYYHLYVAKDFKDTDSSFSADGKIVHDAMKARVVDGKPLPLPLRHHEKIAASFAKAPGEKHGEMRLALTRTFGPCDYFDPEVWVRVVIDLTIVRGDLGIVVDWKTGKVREDFTQLGLNAAVLARWMPEITTFRTVFAWLQSSKLSPRTYVPNDLARVWGDLLPRVNKMETARKTTDFPAKESGLCRYCPVATCPHFKARDE